MVDFNEVGMLLHIEEKLRGHPHLGAIMAHVQAALRVHNVQATDEVPPEVPLTAAEQQRADEAAEAREIAAQQASERQAQSRLVPRPEPTPNVQQDDLSDLVRPKSDQVNLTDRRV